MNTPSPRFRPGIGNALLAAALFGASTPLAKVLIADISPVMLAGLLYAGSGLGLGLWWIFGRQRTATTGEAALQRRDVPWLLGAILSGGVLGPVLLMLGLQLTPASTASLLLNLEAVFTATMAWLAFRENVDHRVFLGMMAIVVAGAILSWDQHPEIGVPWGALAIAGACLCWAVDNNLTRAISASDPVQIAALKGAVAGAINIAIAVAMGSTLPTGMRILEAGAIGLAGYGISLVLFVLALRRLGTARTGAYFSTAPFVGAAIALALLREVPDAEFWIAGALMAVGVWLHVSERHQHEHRHDEHHQHTHDFPWDGSEPHNHAHAHDELAHSHAHFPDIHHRHRHKR